MAKFIDKKEQVYDLKLTNYGHYLLSIGTFKPTYYTFLDDNVIYDKQYAMARRPHATYTQVGATGSQLEDKTLILKDASDTQHTITFEVPSDGFTAQFTTSDTAIVTDLTRSYDIAVQISRAINSASAENKIAMRAGEVFGGLETEDESGDIAPAPYALEGSTASFGLTMDLTGTQGNGKTQTGNVLIMANTHVTISSFVGGFDPVIEPQNEVHKRIKDETQYLESFVLFRDIESGSAEQEIQTEREVVNEEGETETVEVSYFKGDVTPSMMVPEPDVFKYNGIIGDAHLDGDANVVPSWKIVALQGLISSSAAEDTRNNEKIPQININLNYTLDVESTTFDYNPNTIRDVIDSTPSFIDNYAVSLGSDDLMLYVEEINTDILTENFDIEVFKVLTGSGPDVYDTLERKYFRKASNQIINGFMRTERPENLFVTSDTLTNESVEYYFDILIDEQVEQDIACKGAEDFNRSSYYIDIDFDCEQQLGEEAIYYDIYGSAVEPEICLD